MSRNENSKSNHIYFVIGQWLLLSTSHFAVLPLHYYEEQKSGIFSYAFSSYFFCFLSKVNVNLEELQEEEETQLKNI